MEHFSKALQRHPKSLSSIRVVIASCCFKLNQFDRARAILEKALACDVSIGDCSTRVCHFFYPIH